MKKASPCDALSATGGGEGGQGKRGCEKGGGGGSIRMGVKGLVQTKT